MKVETCQFCGLCNENGEPLCQTQREADLDCPNTPMMSDGPLAGLRRNHYRVLYADPPWSFKTYTNSDQGTVPHRSEEAPYESMTREQLLALPVNEITQKDCILHMWTISSHIDQAFELAAAWGFTFKSLGFVWVKTQKGDPETPKMGMGKWTRQEAEICLLFTKGSPSRVSAGVHQVLMESAREHSRKPDGFYERIEALTGGPYVEFFSRSNRPGWDAMGDQKGKFGTVKVQLDAEAESLI